LGEGVNLGRKKGRISLRARDGGLMGEGGELWATGEGGAGPSLMRTGNALYVDKYLAQNIGSRAPESVGIHVWGHNPKRIGFRNH